MNNHSNQRNTWRKLIRNKAALSGMIIIILAMLAAVFAYVISPDHTPDANRMTIEIGGRNPGFTQLFLKIKKDADSQNAGETTDKRGFFHRLIYGQKDAFDYLPITSYTTTNDTLTVQKYIDEGISERVFFPLKGRHVQIGDSMLSGNAVPGNAIWKAASSSQASTEISGDTLMPSSSIAAYEQGKGTGIDTVYGSSQSIPASPWRTASAADTVADTISVIKHRQDAGSPSLVHSMTGQSLEIEQIRFVLGTDKYGRDILSRLLIGVRVSLGVGLVAVILSLSIGILLGSLAGYYRGRVDDAIMWLINVIWSIPTLLLVFAVTLLLGKGFWQVFIAIGLTTWVNVARLIRGQVLSIRGMEYVEAARALGFRDTRIIMQHILPNVMGPVIVIAASNFAAAIVIEAGLSFLGIGVQSPQPSWGLMIKENYNFIITHNPILALAPGFAIMILVLAFNMLGNGLRDALQVKT